MLLKEERDYRGKKEHIQMTFNLAKIRYYSTLQTKKTLKAEEMRIQYQTEYEFCLRNPDQEEYLNKYGLKRALQWEQVYNAHKKRQLRGIFAS